jgi:hypothetical protein
LAKIKCILFLQSYVHRAHAIGNIIRTLTEKQTFEQFVVDIYSPSASTSTGPVSSAGGLANSSSSTSVTAAMAAAAAAASSIALKKELPNQTSLDHGLSSGSHPTTNEFLKSTF